MAPTAKAYDYIVIGGGSGGSATARRAAGWYKAKTLLIENGPSGGCCVNVGCVPKKMTWNFSSIAAMLRDSKYYGYHTPEHIPVTYTTFKHARDAVIKHLNAAYERNWDREGIDLVHGTATFTSPHEVEVKLSDGGTASFTAPHICVATGSYPVVRALPGAEHGITSDDFFGLEELPKKIVIVGAGYVAVEIAGLLHGAGVEVHLLIRGATFLRSFDPMIQHTLTEHYEKTGVKIHKHCKVNKVEKLEGPLKTLKVSFTSESGDETIEANELLWAMGRNPYIDHLGLEKLGVKLGEKNEVLVDEFQNTNVKGIYALGDVTAQVQLTPVAIAAGRQLGNRLFGPPHLSASKMDYKNIPTVIFAHPPVGTVGMTEPAAREKYGDAAIKVYTTNFASMFFDVFPAGALKLPTSMKLICAGNDERIVGMHIIGDGVDEMLQGFGVAIKMGATKMDFDSCAAIHPTSAEELVTLK